MEVSSNQNKAVNDIVEMVVEVIGNGSREIDTMEAISSTARLAGSFLFRSFDFKIENAEPGNVMLSEEANVKGPQLINITHAVLHSFGIQIDNDKMSNSEPKQAESDFVAVMGKIQKPSLQIMERNELSFEQMAQSAAMATAFIIQQSGNISPEEGFQTAIFHYIEGTKTYPPDFLPETGTDAKQAEPESTATKAVSRPWWKKLFGANML